MLDSEAPISVEADFFEVGGNSLMAGKLIAAMRKQLKVPLSVAVIFSHRTVADMATLIAPQVDEEELKSGSGSDTDSDDSRNAAIAKTRSITARANRIKDKIEDQEARIQELKDELEDLAEREKADG